MNLVKNHHKTRPYWSGNTCIFQANYLICNWNRPHKNEKKKKENTESEKCLSCIFTEKNHDNEVPIQKGNTSTETEKDFISRPQVVAGIVKLQKDWVFFNSVQEWRFLIEIQNKYRKSHLQRTEIPLDWPADWKMNFCAQIMNAHQPVKIWTTGIQVY
jgi:hypothetical protein